MLLCAPATLANPALAGSTAGGRRSQRLSTSSSSPAALPRRRLASAASRGSRRATAAPLAALPGAADNLPVEPEELPKWLTLAAYAASVLAPRAGIKFQLTPELLYSGLTWYTLIWAALTAILPGSFNFDRVGSVVGPAFLATNALGGLNGLISPFETAVAGFGAFMVDKLPAFPYSRWFWLASLAAAIYAGMPAQWLVGAFFVSSAWNLFRQVTSGGGVRPQEAAFAGLAAWAFLRGAEVPVALAIMAGQMLAAIVT